MKGSDIVRFAKVIPGDDFQELRLKLEDLLPSLLPQPVGVENPILVERVGRVVSEEPGRDGCMIVSNEEIEGYLG
jgi:hypothetical protein